MKFTKFGWVALLGFAFGPAACASEADSGIGGASGSGNTGSYGGLHAGGFSTGGPGNVGTGGPGNVATGGTGNVGTGGTGNVGTGGTGNVGTGGTGNVGTGGTGNVGTGATGGAGTGGAATGGAATGGNSGTGGFGTGGFGTGGASGGGSCVGNCGFSDPTGTCFCDTDCVSFGDCCSDYNTVCGGSGGSGGGGTGGTGGGGTGGVATGGTGGTGGTTGSCQNAEECSNPATMICSPTTLKCEAGQCTANSQCGTNQACLGQVASPVVGACYPKCTPYASSSGCTSTKDCVPYLLDGSEGACFAKGTTADGATCTDTDVGTGCVAGSICVRDSGVRVCRRQCNYFASSPACVASQRCALGGVCIAEGGDAAAVGAACSSSSAAGEICGNDGKAWRGTCQDIGSGLRCYKVCRTSTASDCSGSQTCSPFQGDSTAGVCI